MRASKAEFEQRFWVFGAMFGVAFGLYTVDKTPFAVWLIQVIAPHVDITGPQGASAAKLIFAVGALLCFLAAGIRTWATAYLRTEIVHDISQHADSVVADGPYRYTRNPLYLANLPFAAGLGTMASRSGFAVLVVAMWVFAYRLIGREEQVLLETQGESYRRFLQAVPRFWPSLTPRLPASGARPHWPQAFVGESMFWFAGIALIAFLLTFSLPVFGIVYGLGFALYFTGVQYIRKRATRDN